MRGLLLYDVFKMLLFGNAIVVHKKIFAVTVEISAERGRWEVSSK